VIVKRLSEEQINKHVETIMKRLTPSLFCLTALTLACGTLLAAGQSLPDRAITVGSGAIHPNVGNDAGLKTIFSNLGSKTDTYDDTNGWSVNGPKCSVCTRAPEWIAMPFTPKVNATVTQIQIALQYNNSGTDGFNLVLAADSAGLPGKSLHSWDEKSLPNFGTCCKLVTAKYATGVKVTKGKRYWVVARTDSKSGDAHDAWDWTWNDSRGLDAYKFRSGWLSLENDNLCAFAVQGEY
jgi:hypothetical protein